MLKETGLKVEQHRVGRLMRENGVRVERSKEYMVTTDSNHTFKTTPNLLPGFPLNATKPEMGGRHQLSLEP